MRFRRLLLAAIVTILAILAGAPGTGRSEAQELPIPEMTEAGDWNGTWMYVSREHWIAIYFRGEEERPELRFQYQGSSRPEQFETDWLGKASYYFGGKPALLEIGITEPGKNRIKGTWRRETSRGTGRLTEQADLELFRSADGRFMVVRFENLVQTLELPGAEPRVRKTARMWTFRKVSRRVVRWEEIPF